jgi:hypothetical protein
MKWSYKPTRLSSALITSIISALLIFLTVEVLMIVMEDVGIIWNLSYILVFVVFVGVIISMTVLYAMARKPMYWN